MKMKWKVIVLCLAMVSSLAISASAALVYDAFTRPAGPALGNTEDPAHLPWIGDPGSVLTGTTLNTSNTGGTWNWSFGTIGTLTPGNFDLTATVRLNSYAETNSQLVIAMRQAAPNTPIGDGYFLAVLPAWGDLGGASGWLLMRHDGTNARSVAQGGLANVDWTQYHDVRVVANGNSWSVWFDGGQPLASNVADVGSEALAVKTAGGLISFGEIIGNADYDYVSVNVIPEPASLFALGSGLIGMVGFAIRRKK